MFLTILFSFGEIGNSPKPNKKNTHTKIKKKETRHVLNNLTPNFGGCFTPQPTTEGLGTVWKLSLPGTLHPCPHQQEVACVKTPRCAGYQKRSNKFGGRFCAVVDVVETTFFGCGKRGTELGQRLGEKKKIYFDDEHSSSDMWVCFFPQIKHMWQCGQKK